MSISILVWQCMVLLHAQLCFWHVFTIWNMAEGLATLLPLYCSCGVLNHFRAGQIDGDMCMRVHTYAMGFFYYYYFFFDGWWNRETVILSLSILSLTSSLVSVLIQNDLSSHLKIHIFLDYFTSDLVNCLLFLIYR